MKQGATGLRGLRARDPCQEQYAHDQGTFFFRHIVKGEGERAFSHGQTLFNELLDF